MSSNTIIGKGTSEYRNKSAQLRQDQQQLSGGTSTSASAKRMKVNVKVYDDRYWLNQRLKWEEGRGDKPGPHPNPKHKWNTHPELYDLD